MNTGALDDNHTMTCGGPLAFAKNSDHEGFVTLVTYTTTRLRTVARNVNLASCPGMVVVAVTAGPSMVMAPVTSDGAELTCTVKEFGCIHWEGSMRTVYVPVAGSVVTSI